MGVGRRVSVLSSMRYAFVLLQKSCSTNQLYIPLRNASLLLPFSAASWALRLEARLILMIFIFSTTIHARYIGVWALLEAGHAHLLVGLSLLRMPVRAYNNNICYQYPMCISSLGSNHHTSASTNTTSIITSTFIITTHRPLPHQLSRLRSSTSTSNIKWTRSMMYNS